MLLIQSTFTKLKFKNSGYNISLENSCQLLLASVWPPDHILI